jgi:hypothetical protein
MIKVVFGLPLRSLQEFVESLIVLLRLPIITPNYTTIRIKPNSAKFISIHQA